MYDRLGQIAREHGVWLVTGVNELDPVRNGTVYRTCCASTYPESARLIETGASSN